MTKTFLFIAAVTFCTAASMFSFYAASAIVHNPGWEIVQNGVLFMGICWTGIAIVLLETVGRRLRKLGA